MANTFTLEQATKAFPQFSVSDLRNYIKRGILRNVGTTPYAGQERRFDIYGMIEIGLVAALRDAGVSLAQAGTIVSSRISRAKYSRPELKIEHLENWANSYPENPIRTVEDPEIWVFPHESVAEAYGGFDNCLNFANGWEDLPFAIKRLYNLAAGQDVTVPYAQTGFSLNQMGAKIPLVWTFNLTATMIPIKAAIQGILSTKAETDFR